MVHLIDRSHEHKGKQASPPSRLFAVVTPPLENGDRLTRIEFERRYEAMPEIKKAELIEGVVYMPSPVRVSHSKPHAHIMTWLGMYCAVTPGVDLYDNATVRLDVDNEVQPDALLRRDSNLGGTSQISSDDYIEGAPELIVEVAASSASYDLHDKFTVYRRNGVQEYVVWRVYDKEVDWYNLEEGAYVSLMPGEDGILRSQVFPGLHLAVEALLDSDLARVLDELQKGLATPEYKAYIELLSSRRNIAEG
jgi:Uma2 family endonuclease